jgi:hypothetical protein
LAEVGLMGRCKPCEPGVLKTVIGAMEDITAEGQIDIDEQEEIEPLRMFPDPGQPTPEQIDEHRTSGHQPYRCWCKFCVMGRGLGEQHRARPKSMIPRIGIDYFYLTDRGIHKREELEEYPNTTDGALRMQDDRQAGKLVKCLIVRDWETKNVFGHVIPVKGADEDAFAASLASEDIKWLGHTRVILKGDNENSLKAL